MVDRVPFVVESIYQVEGLTPGTPIFITKFVPAEVQTPCLGAAALLPPNPTAGPPALKTVFPGNVSLARSVTPLLLSSAGPQKFAQVPAVTSSGTVQAPSVNSGNFFPSALQQEQSKPLMVTNTVGPDAFAQQFTCPVRPSLSIAPVRYQQVMTPSSTPMNDVNAEFLSHIVGLVSAVPRAPRAIQQVCIGPSLPQGNIAVPPPPQSPSITSSVNLQPNLPQVRVATPPVGTGADRPAVVINVPAPGHPQFSNSISSAGFTTTFQQNRSVIPLPFTSSDTERFTQFTNTVPPGSIANVPTSLAVSLQQQSSAMAMQPVLYPSFTAPVSETGIAIVATSATSGEITEIIEAPDSPSIDSSHQEEPCDVEMEMQADLTPETVSTTSQTNSCEENDELYEERHHSDTSSLSISSKSSQATCDASTFNQDDEVIYKGKSPEDALDDITDSSSSVVVSNEDTVECSNPEKSVQICERTEQDVSCTTVLPVPEQSVVNSNTEDKCIETSDIEESGRKAIEAYLNKQDMGPFQCEDCGKLYSQRMDLERHMWKHTGEKLTAYSESKMSYDTSLAPNQKSSKSTDKCYCCKWCGAAFRRIVSLRKHVGTHSKHLHTCEQCGKTFATKEDLTNHIRNHSGAKSLFCGECGRVFMERAKLKNHIKEHQKQWLGIITRLALNTTDS
ncbi:zinc finger protein 37-like [Schistocerca piceifrons]|uniref:zinc finger protein 37-like n=1 Tax=Schistocerca piceifrons TaxID=274613 RepID=UPI001F5EEFBD|nr:zinc finger protein 37-like [Schistocerca piceifrons]